MCNSDATETNSTVERLLTQVPEEEFTKDKDDKTCDANEAEATVIKQVKRISLQPINANIDPQLLL